MHILQVTLKIDDEDNLLLNTESMGNDVPSYELTKVSATRSGISSTASAEDASFVSLTVLKNFFSFFLIVLQVTMKESLQIIVE